MFVVCEDQSITAAQYVVKGFVGTKIEGDRRGFLSKSMQWGKYGDNAGEHAEGENLQGGKLGRYAMRRRCGTDGRDAAEREEWVYVEGEGWGRKKAAEGNNGEYLTCLIATIVPEAFSIAL